MEKILEVKCGSIYTNSGLCIEHIGVVFDKEAGILLKYGDSTNELNDYFIKMVNDFRKQGFGDIADNLILIEFDRYDGILSVDEICTFVNYMVMCSANGEKVLKMLSMKEEDLKKELKKLSEFGY